ncbi:MAG TPA: AAA family ATPase [Pedobacter sp.]|nr:AAA family ATPase [Pedobacter sp.]
MPNTERETLLLKSIHLKGFKSIEDLSVDVKPGLNILIGKNGSGKSNFLEFLEGAIGRGHKLNYTFASLDYFSKTKNFQLSFEKEKAQKNFKNKLDAGIDNEYLTKVDVEGKNLFNSKAYVSGQDQEAFKLFQKFAAEVTGITHAEKSPNGFRYLQRILKPLIIKFNIPETIGFVSTPGVLTVPYDGAWSWTDTLDFIDDIVWDLEFLEDGIDFNSDNTKQGIITDFKFSEEIIDNLKLFTPIKNLRLNDGFSVYDADKNFIVDNLRLDFLINDTWVPWSYLSDGTKRLFYIVTEITFKKDGLILIEEPELGIHPHQFHLLMNFLKEQSSDKQIIISTHSPKALDILNPDELDHIMIATYDVERGTQINGMTENQKIKAKDYMSEVGFLSDYWLMSDLEEYTVSRSPDYQISQLPTAKFDDLFL